jgi:hypothetical protein
VLPGHRSTATNNSDCRYQQALCAIVGHIETRKSTAPTLHALQAIRELRPAASRFP